MSYSIAAIVGALIALSGTIIARKPDMKGLFEKIMPYQGWIGVGLFGYGLYWLFLYVIPNFGAFTAAPLTLAIVVAMLVSGVGLGFLLGFSLLSKYLFSKNETARVKGEELRLKLAAVQMPVAVVALVSGISSFVV